MRGLRRALVVLLVLAVLVVVADRVADWVAQRAVADQVATELAGYQVDSEPPEVSIGGFPFLTQVAAGEYETVTVRLRDVGSAGLRLPLVELTATDVTAPVDTLVSGQGSIVAARVTGTATIGYAGVVGLTGLAGLRLAAADGGGVRVELPTELAGTPVTVVGTGDVTVEGAVVRLRVDDLTVEQRPLPPGAESLIDDLAQQLSVDLPLPPLPYGLAVESVRAGAAGLEVALSARNVPLAR